jgi:TDG/mug DNA glycosylase family protein
MDLSTFDILAPNLPVVFCGINPSTQAAASGHNFGSPSNRFWPILHLSGFTPVRIAAQDDRRLLAFGCGITAAVPRATRSAGELDGRELRTSGNGLRAKIEHFRPETIAFLGKAAYEAIEGTKVGWGPQASRFGGAAVWILPNPSGLNRSFGLTALVEAYTALRVERSSSLKRWVARQSAEGTERADDAPFGQCMRGLG